MKAPASRRNFVLGAVTLPALAGGVAYKVASLDAQRQALRDSLLHAYAEERACRPIENVAHPFGVEFEACTLVSKRVWAICDEIAELPAPTSHAELGLLALAAAIEWEEHEPEDGMERLGLALLQGVLAFANVSLPEKHNGLGASEASNERYRRLVLGAEGRIPEWAMAKATADRRARMKGAPPLATHTSASS